MKKLFLLMAVLAILLLIFAGSALANPPDPYLSDPTPQPVPTGSVPSNGFQGWSLFEFSAPAVGGSYDNTPTYYNFWYTVGVWGNTSNDGRGAFYVNMFDNTADLYVDPNVSVWLSGLNNGYVKQGHTTAYDSTSGAWRLFDFTYSGFAGSSPGSGWIQINPSFHGTNPPIFLPSSLSLGPDPNNPNPQYLNTADDGGGSPQDVEYYNIAQEYSFNPTNGIYSGSGVSTGWFAHWTFLPPDISITVDAGNTGQPVPAGQTVTGTWTITNNSDMEWEGNEVQLYLADSAGNILSTLATFGGSGTNIDLQPGQSTTPQTFTWTMPANQPNGVEIAGSVNELLTGTLVPGPSNGYHVSINSPNTTPYINDVSQVTTNADADWSNNLSIIPVPLAQSSGSSPALVATPATATVSVGGQQQYRATYYPTGTGGTGQDVTTSANWYSGNTGIATVIVTGSSGGLATGAAQGTTGITASYSGLQASVQIQVTQAGGNLAVTSMDPGVSASGGSVRPGSNYTATASFSNTFTVGANGGTSVEIDWYMDSGNGFQELPNGDQRISIAANGTASASIQWQYPSTGPQQVTLMVAIDDPYYNGSYHPMSYPPTGQQETRYDDNNKESIVNYSAPVTVNGQWQAGYAMIPEQVPTQEPYTFPVHTWTNVPIVPGPDQNWGPVRYYISY